MLWTLGAVVCAFLAGFVILGPNVKGRISGFSACMIFMIVLLTQIPHDQSSMAGGWAGGAFACGLAFALLTRLAAAINRGAAARKQMKARQAAEPSTPGAQIAARPEVVRATDDGTAPRVPFPPESGQCLARGFYLPVLLSYRDASGTPTQRKVTVQYIGGWGTTSESRALRAASLVGWCHLRQDVRTFSLDRIMELTDLETGEVVTDAEAWATRRFGLIVPLAPYRLMQTDPLPPPVVFRWQRQPDDIEVYDLRIVAIDTVGGRPIGLRGDGRRRKGSKRRAASGSYTFDLAPLPEEPCRPVSIAWTDSDEPSADVVGWVKKLLDPPINS